MDKLKDIKHIVTIPDNSLMLLIIIIIVFIILIIAIIYYYIHKKNKKNYRKKIAISTLKKLDFNNSKVVAYKFKMFGEELITIENKEIFININQQLEAYKYKKQVGKLDVSLIKQIQEFINV